jgi:hypothetical protein
MFSATVIRARILERPRYRRHIGPDAQHLGGEQAGGESGIRTHGTVSRTHAFQACALSHSAISPDALS